MISRDRVAGTLLWLWLLIKGWLPQALAVASAGFAIVCGVYGGGLWTDGLWSFIAAVTLAALSLIAQGLVQRPSYMALTKQRDEAVEESAAKSQALEQSLTVLLRKLAEYCSVSSNSDRTSVYYFHEERFIMLARWSIHPDYARPGRGEYPTRQGAIGEAWDRGSAVILLPSTRRRWEQRLESAHGFSSDEAARLAMHCQSIAALRIEVDDHAVGVIVFESLDPARVSQGTLDTAQSSLLYATLAELVGAVARMTPRLEQVVKSAEQMPGPDWKQVGTA